MSNIKKLMMSAAGGAGPDVEDVFSTYLYTGNGSTQTITNGIDLDGEGGMIWQKIRTGTYSHSLVDTERGGQNTLQTNGSDAQVDRGNDFVTSFNSDGFSIGADALINQNGNNYASWTFRKAPKFFDVQTFTTTYNVDPNVISHNLDGELGCAIFKQLDSTGQGYNWVVYHRSLGLNKYLKLNSASAEVADNNSFEAVDNSAGTISFGYPMSDVASRLVSGGTETTNWVGYFFAHNNGDGEFGPDGDADIIKCGSYTGGSGNTEIDLGFEPQWLMIKRTDSAEDWLMLDVMRGLFVSGDDVFAQGQRDLLANTSAAEAEPVYAGVSPQPNGFKVRSGLDALYSANGGTYIYIAIRRGPLAAPESGTEVFDINIRSGTSSNATITSNIVVDKVITFGRNSSGSFGAGVNTRLTSPFYLRTYGTQSQNNITNGVTFNEVHTGFEVGSDGGSGGLFNNSSVNYVDWMWKRAPGFFDVVAYTGTGTSGYATINHNLGVVPEMVWFKNRSSSATPRGNWYVYHKDLVNSGGYVYLNSTSAEATDYSGWASSTFAPSATGFTVLKNTLHYTNENYIAYLFATVNGISKVGSFTGNGSSTGDSQNIDCGFSSGARFVLVKAISAAGAWFLFDTERGIVAGNDSHLSLNSTDAEDTSRDLIDPLNSGFTINYHSDWGNQLNGNGQTYMFYAIA